MTRRQDEVVEGASKISKVLTEAAELEA